MKKIILFNLLLFLFSCSEDAQERIPASVDLSSFQFVDTKTNVEVNLLKDGNTVSTDTLQNFTKYHLIIESDEEFALKFKFIDGFSIIETESQYLTFAKRHSISIKTGESSKVYFSMVPLIKSGKELVRTKPQGFLLPN